MKNQSLLLPTPQSFHCVETSALLAELAVEAEAIEAYRAGIASAASADAPADLASFDVAGAASAGEARRQDVAECAQMELRYRRRLDTLLQRQAADISDEISRVHEATETAKIEVADGLRGIGFAVPTAGKFVPGSYMAGWVNSHPRILAGLAELSRLRAIAGGHRRINRESMVEIEETLSAYHRDQSA